MTPRDWDAEFEAIAEETPEYYPGSSKVIVRHPNRKQSETRKEIGIDPEWDVHPRVYPLDGVDTEFFTIGDLARALGREAATIRKWERDGVIPKASYQIPGADGNVHGRRRLYTRRQVEGIVKAAMEEGLTVDSRKPFKDTEFIAKVRTLFVVPQ